MKEDNPWESNKQEINHKYNAHVCCKTLGDALDAYTFLLYRGYSLANTHSPQALRTVLSLNRHIATEDCGASCCGIKTLEESARWHKYIKEKNVTGYSKPLINCLDNIELFKAIAAITDDDDLYQWFIINYSDSNEYWVFNDTQKHIDDKQKQIYRKATLKEIVEHFNNKERLNMAEIVTKEEMAYALKELINANDLQFNVAWYYTELARKFPKKAVDWNNFAEVYPNLIANKIAYEGGLRNKKCFISIPITGREEFAREECKEAQELLSTYFPSCEFFSPFEVAPEKNMPDSYYMGKDVEQLMDCDIIIQMNGWENSKGCRVENFIADTYRIDKISYSTISKYFDL